MNACVKKKSVANKFIFASVLHSQADLSGGEGAGDPQ